MHSHFIHPPLLTKIYYSLYQSNPLNKYDSFMRMLSHKKFNLRPFLSNIQCHNPQVRNK